MVIKDQFKIGYRAARTNLLGELEMSAPFINKATKCLVARQTRKSGLRVRLMNYKAKKGTL